jgi:hypothetical protein
MIKNILKRRKESNTYLATICRYRWSTQITMKIDKLLELSSAEEEVFLQYFIYFLCDLSTPAISADSSQVGVALFSSF